MNDRTRTGNALGESRNGSFLAASLMSLSIAFTVVSPLSAHDRGHRIEPPPVPSDIVIEEGNEAFLVGHAEGTQNYVCLPAGSSVAWVLFTPQATLFTDRGRQIQTHFFSPNPEESGTVRATWEDSEDTSVVWGKATGMSSDSAYVAADAIAWLRVEIVGSQEGPRGGDELTGTTFIQRLNTTGGKAPSTGCTVSTDVGNRAYVPYTADYYFFREDRRGRR
jgi:hypothetical protein